MAEVGREGGAMAAEGAKERSWFAELSVDEKRTFWASFGGFALDAMDILLYSFVIPTLITLWSMTRTDAGLIISE